MGQRIWVQVWVFEQLPGFEVQPTVIRGTSKMFSVVLLDSPTPLLGLESFSLARQDFGVEDFHVERHGGDVLVRWLNYGNATYSVESTTHLTSAGSWTELWRGSGGSPGAGGVSVTNAIADEQRFFRLKMWRW